MNEEEFYNRMQTYRHWPIEDQKGVTNFFNSIWDEFKSAEKRGAQRMIDLLNEHSPFIESFGKTIICDQCMEIKEIWKKWGSKK